MRRRRPHSPPRPPRSPLLLLFGFAARPPQAIRSLYPIARVRVAELVSLLVTQVEAQFAAANVSTARVDPLAQYPTFSVAWRERWCARVGRRGARHTRGGYGVVRKAPNPEVP